MKCAQDAGQPENCRAVWRSGTHFLTARMVISEGFFTLVPGE